MGGLGDLAAGRHVSPRMRGCRGGHRPADPATTRMQRSRRPGRAAPALTPRRTPRGSGRRRAAPGARRRAPAARISSRTALTPAERRSRCCELVADQRPGELELLVGALRRRGPRSPSDSRCVEHPRPDVVDAGVLQAGAGEHRRDPALRAAVHQPQRAGQLLGRRPRLVGAVAVGLVHRDHVGDLEDALLDPLQLVAGAGQGQEQERVDHARPRSPRTGRRRRSRPAPRRTPRPRARSSPGSSPGPRRRACRPRARAGCRRAGRRPAAPSGSCRRAPSRRCAPTTGRPRARRPGRAGRSAAGPSVSMNVDLPTPGTPEMPTRTVAAVHRRGELGEQLARGLPGGRRGRTRPA